MDVPHTVWCNAIIEIPKFVSNTAMVCNTKGPLFNQLSIHASRYVTVSRQ